MVDRRRFFVAVVVRDAVAGLVDGLREGLGSPELGRIAPHITLAPPRNVAPDAVAALLDSLRATAARHVPFEVALGPVHTFPRAQPVVHLAVRDPDRRIHDLAADVRSDVLTPSEREDRYPFVPHVTLLARASLAVAEGARSALHAFDVDMVVGDVSLLEQRDEGGRRWVEIADAALGAPTVRGRGGIEIELFRSRRIDERAAETLGIDAARAVHRADERPWAVVAKVAGAVVGAAWGGDREVRHIDGVVVVASERRQGVASRLLDEAERADAVAVVSRAPQRDALDRLLVGRGYRPERSVADPRVRFAKAL